jgi:hypothetical protein
MATNLPGALDTSANLPDITSADQLDTPGKVHHEVSTTAHQAILWLEGRVGIPGTSVSTAHEKRISDLEGTGELGLVEGDAINLVESGSNLTIASLPMIVPFSTASQALTPALATSEIGTSGLRIVKVDLTNGNEARITVAVTATTTSANARFEYSTTGTGSWGALDGSSGPSVSLSTTGVKVSSWVALASGAKADVFIRAVTQSGDGAATCTVGTILLQVR